MNQKFVDSQIAHRPCAFVQSCHIHDLNNSKFCNNNIFTHLTWKIARPRLAYIKAIYTGAGRDIGEFIILCLKFLGIFGKWYYTNPNESA